MSFARVHFKIAKVYLTKTALLLIWKKVKNTYGFLRPVAEFDFPIFMQMVEESFQAKEPTHKTNN